MKELSIEDKAKRYDEAIERAKSKIKNDKDHVLYEYDILDIFPELKESEDERIWKDVYNYLYNERHNIRQLTPYTDELDRWLAWLEKQKPINISIEDKRIRKSLINYVKAHGNGGDFTKEKYIAWLEKQGEQKDFIPKEEPKFKVGDWIVFNGLTLYVKEVVKGFYRTTSKGGITNSYDWDIDNAARLWTIQDAKDGDVLRLGCIIAMFKKYIGQEKCICYCSISEDGDFEIPIENGEDNIYGCTHTTPATKEQCELLFTKMKEEGYEWNAENKELKKENLSDFESALFTAFSDAWQQYLLGEKVNVEQWAKEHSSELIEIAKQNDKTIA